MGLFHTMCQNQSFRMQGEQEFVRIMEVAFLVRIDEKEMDRLIVFKEGYKLRPSFSILLLR